MTFTPALAAGQYTKLRSTSYAAAQYVSLCPNDNVVSSTVLSVPATTTIAQITLNDTPTGAQAGQTVLISETNDRRAAYFRGRIRKAPVGDTIYINETSTDVDIGDYVWILDDYDLHAKLPVDNGTTYYKDFDEAYHAPNPILYNLPSSVAGFEDATGFLEVIFAPLYILTNPDATTISTWFWEEDDGTFVVGNANTQNVTIKFPPGFRWIHLTATDDIGRSQTFHIQVHAHDDSTYPPELDFRGSEITNDVDSGWAATLGAFAGVSDVLDRTAVTIWSQEYYGGVEGTLYGVIGRVEFTGRLRSESNTGTGDAVYSFLKEVSFPGEGIGTRLAALDALPLAIRNDSTPTVWDELEDLTIWRAIAHYLDSMTTFCTIHSLSFDDITDTFLYKELGTPDSRVLDTVNDLAGSINAAMEFGPDGQTQVIRSARYLSQAGRDALTTLGNYEDQDLVDLTLDRDYIAPIGQVEADGGVFNTLSDQVSAAFSFAPGHAQNEGGDKASLSGQVLPADTTLDAARTELNFRSGQHLVARNPLDTLSVYMPPGYHAFAASRGAYFTWTLTGTQNVRGLSYTTNDKWMLSALSFTHDNDSGARETNHVYQAIGDAAPAGSTYIPPAAGDTPNPYGNVPIVGPYPGIIEPVVAPKQSEWPTVPIWQTNGQSVVIGTDNNLWACHGFLGNELAYTDITPSAGDEVKAFQFGKDGSRAYCLMFDGSDSYIYTTSEIKADPVVWTQGQVLAGEYNDIRLGSTTGEVYAYSNGQGVASSFEHTFDFTVDDGSWVVVSSGVYVAGTYWSTTNCYGTRQCIGIRRTFSARRITEVKITGNCGAAGNGGYRAIARNGVPDNITQAAGAFVHTDSRDTDAVTYFDLALDTNTLGAPINTVTEIVVKGTGSNPFGGGGTFATTAYSTDHGATATFEIVGTSPATNGGMDTIKVGTVVLAGQSAKVRTATSGGAYSDETNGAVAGSNPALIVIPYYDFNASTLNTSDATPEYLLGADAAVGGAALWRVTDGGKADVSITIAATLALVTDPNAGAFSWYDSGKFAVIVDVSGTMHLVTTTNAFTANTDRGAINAAALYVRMNKADLTSTQLFLADGTAGPAYSLDFGASLINQPWPTADAVTIIEPYSGIG